MSTLKPSINSSHKMNLWEMKCLWELKVLNSNRIEDDLKQIEPSLYIVTFKLNTCYIQRSHNIHL